MLETQKRLKITDLKITFYFLCIHWYTVCNAAQMYLHDKRIAQCILL